MLCFTVASLTDPYFYIVVMGLIAVFIWVFVQWENGEKRK